ncbi:30S ribosomal protein S20 [Blastopirellula sp. JC732]|uniref:Small ribosomal subunit protein bS20 n=1 Tax=Blastopirellula sediminis TaxID=2894196 RepID=A0A9X1SIN9_9BACT|nr:30S ribosomal protein S20 [Blastopirellula sediminis]MCC9605218.1 30S ribosomal protein S20 [Blastopirellula sediminis]MCC9631482.1 30S ribosomal protein S20 [Blastopirellula sediminis]
MPNTKSAKKRLRQNEVRRARNRAVKSALRHQVRKVRAAVAAGDVGVMDAELKAAVKRLDKTAAAGVIHANTAARLKSRLNAHVKNAKAAKA